MASSNDRSVRVGGAVEEALVSRQPVVSVVGLWIVSAGLRIDQIAGFLDFGGPHLGMIAQPSEQRRRSAARRPANDDGRERGRSGRSPPSVPSHNSNPLSNIASPHRRRRGRE